LKSICLVLGLSRFHPEVRADSRESINNFGLRLNRFLAGRFDGQALQIYGLILHNGIKRSNIASYGRGYMTLFPARKKSI
jgi:hypothetical protein